MNSEQFPTLFENSEIKVYKNSSDEIFIQRKVDPPVKMRITPGLSSLTITSGNGGGIMTPYSVNGLSAFKVWHPYQVAMNLKESQDQS